MAAGYDAPCLCKSDTVATNVEHWNPECPYHKRRDVVDEAFQAVDKLATMRAQRDRYREALGRVMKLVELYRDGVQADLVVSRTEEIVLAAQSRGKPAKIERDRYREALEAVRPWMVDWLQSWADEFDEPEDRAAARATLNALREILDALTTESEE
jgi:hypothetical protein